MRKFRFYFALFCLVSIFSGFGFAEETYICVGSYKNQENALQLLQKLGSFNVSAFVNQVELERGTHYRVLLSSGFDSKDSARIYKNEVLTFPFVHHLNLKGLWICSGEEINIVAKNYADSLPASEVDSSKEIEPSPLPAAVPENAVVLQKNVQQEIPLSQEKPYSVLVRSYKEEQAAENDQKRLEEKNIDSYILKTYDDKTYFSFDLHSGAFETPEETEPLIEQLAEIGIEDTEVSDYAEIVEKIQKYDDVIKTEQVVYEDGNNEIPAVFSPKVQEVIKQFPVNKNFQIEKIEIYDFDNMKAEGETLPSFENELQAFENKDSIQAVSLANYKDFLYEKEIKVIIAAGENFEETENKTEEAEKQKFKITNGILDCQVFEKNGKFVLYGKNPENNLAVLMEANDFTQEEFLNFINDTTNDSGLLAYPQLRKTLMVLPNENPDVERTFTKFELSRVEQIYAQERSNAEWALAIVGHWHAGAEMKQDGKHLKIGFFDLDYDYNAKKIHEMFMDDKIKDDAGHYSDVKNCVSWYLPSIWAGNEISFNTKSYIIALDSYRMGETELVEAANDLKIWNESTEPADNSEGSEDSAAVDAK
ncbi:MAG: SPOR domain-containing protein [Treponema sp.]|nr:SPOR domain-containing protein [Candidatus Treponema equifaecale]